MTIVQLDRFLNTVCILCARHNIIIINHTHFKTTTTQNNVYFTAATLANASVKHSQILTTLLLADRPAEMKFGTQGELFSLWHCQTALPCSY